MILKLIDLGRNKTNATIDLSKPSLRAVMKEIKKHLGSKYPEIEETDDPNTFIVCAGTREVGKIWVENPECLNK